jgi:hypothetical protein
MLALVAGVLLVMLSFGLIYSFTNIEAFNLDVPSVTKRAEVRSIVCIVIFFIAGHVLFIHEYGEKDDTEMVEHWIQHDVTPFVQGLPAQSVDLIAIEEATSSDDASNDFFPSVDEKVSTTIVSVTYNDDQDKKVKQTIKASSIKDLSTGSNAQMTYRLVEKDLGHGVDKGLYNVIIHEPSLPNE